MAKGKSTWTSARPDHEQPSLIELDKSWRESWKDMPEYDQKDARPFKSLVVHFESRADVERFALLVGQKLTRKTKSIWYPGHKDESHVELGWDDDGEDPNATDSTYADALGEVYEGEAEGVGE